MALAEASEGLKLRVLRLFNSMMMASGMILGVGLFDRHTETCVELSGVIHLQIRKGDIRVDDVMDVED